MAVIDKIPETIVDPIMLRRYFWGPLAIQYSRFIYRVVGIGTFDTHQMLTVQSYFVSLQLHISAKVLNEAASFPWAVDFYFQLVSAKSNEMCLVLFLFC